MKTRREQIIEVATAGLRYDEEKAKSTEQQLQELAKYISKAAEYEQYHYLRKAACQLEFSLACTKRRIAYHKRVLAKLGGVDNA